MIIEGIEIGSMTDEIADVAVLGINVMITSLLGTIDEVHPKSPDEIQGVQIDEIVIDVSNV